MPFYEYQCKSCGHTLEAMQKVQDAPLKKCPDCGKSQLQRLMSAPVFRLKGGGWYETDFKSDKDNKRNLADRPEAAEAKDDKKTDGAAAKDATEGGKSAETQPSDKVADKPAAESAKKTVEARPAAAKKTRPAAKRPARKAVKRAASSRRR
jgi:putative FmdB family regulatory protein